METEPIGNAIGVPAPDENNPGNNSQQNLFAFLFGNNDNSQNGHDTSGHCQKMIHVPAHSREGKPVNAYERICGRDHDEKEAQQKNQAEKNENNVKLTTEQLAKKAFEFMQSHEGGILHPYFDSKGNLTVGYGTRIYNQAQYAAMDWKINNISLTKTQKEVNYEKAMALKSEYGHNRIATSQRKMKLLGQISDSDARFMAEQHIQKEFIPIIRNNLAQKNINFDTLPPSAQIACIDLAYNTGSILGFPRMLESIQINDFTQAAERSHRQAPIPESRNQAVHNLFIDAQKEYEQSKHKIGWQ